MNRGELMNCSQSRDCNNKWYEFGNNDPYIVLHVRKAVSSV